MSCLSVGSSSLTIPEEFGGTFCGSTSLVSPPIAAVPVFGPRRFARIELLSMSGRSFLTSPERDPLDEVQEFIERNGLQFYVVIATQLARECLPLDSEPSYSIAQDPESGAEWVEVRARVHGGRSAVRDGHRRFTRAWLAQVPPDRSLDVRLSISFV